MLRLVPQILAIASVCGQSSLLWSRADVCCGPQAYCKSSASGIGKASLHGFSVPTEVLHVTPHVTDPCR